MPKVVLPGYIDPDTIVDTGYNAPSDHGLLTGLADDDHTQYFNQARGDARYSLGTHLHTGVYSPAAHNHTGTYAPATHNHPFGQVTGLDAEMAFHEFSRYFMS